MSASEQNKEDRPVVALSAESRETLMGFANDTGAFRCSARQASELAKALKEAMALLDAR